MLTVWEKKGNLFHKTLKFHLQHSLFPINVRLLCYYNYIFLTLLSNHKKLYLNTILKIGGDQYSTQFIEQSDISNVIS